MVFHGLGRGQKKKDKKTKNNPFKIADVCMAQQARSFGKTVYFRLFGRIKLLAAALGFPTISVCLLSLDVCSSALEIFPKGVSKHA